MMDAPPDDIDWDKNREQAKLTVHDELSDPVGFVGRLEYELYLDGFLHGGLGVHERSREEYLKERLPSQVFDKSGNPVEWTRHSEKVATALHTNKLKPWAPRELKRLPVLHANRKLSIIPKTATMRRNSVPHPAPSAPVHTESSNPTLYDSGCRYISELIQSDPGKKKVLEALKPPEDLTSSLEMLESLFGVKPKTGTQPKNITKRAHHYNQQHHRKRFSVETVLICVAGAVSASTVSNDADDVSLGGVAVQPSATTGGSQSSRSVSSETSVAVRKMPLSAALDNPLVNLILSDTSCLDVSEHLMMELLQGFLSVSSPGYMNTMRLDDPDSVILQHFSPNGPSVPFLELKSCLRRAALSRADAYHRKLVEGNLKRAVSQRSDSITFLALVQCLLPARHLGRVVKRVTFRLEKSVKEGALKGKDDRECRLAEADALEVAAIFNQTAVSGYLTKDAFLTLVHPASMTSDEVSAVFEEHSTNGVMVLEQFCDILKTSYPPFGSDKNELYKTPKNQGVHEKVGTLKKQLQRTKVHFVAPLVSTKNHHTRQSRRMGKLTELSGCAKRVKKLTGPTTNTSATPMGLNPFRSVREAMKQSSEEPADPVFMGGVEYE